jgi:predicted O-methyltransferase YrrM
MDARRAVGHGADLGLILSVQKQIKSGLRLARDLVVGRQETPLMTHLIRGDARSTAFFNVMEYVNFERVPGDIVELGVFTGISLALLAQGHAFDDKGMTRRVVGFDSFDGLPASEEHHDRWRTGDCATSHGRHPLIEPGARVTPDATRQLFAACGLDEPVLHVGLFDDTVPAVIPSRYPRVAVVHVDCDLYESTRTALSAIAPALQDGTVVLFDDWFHYRANPGRGEARAFAEFLEERREWRAVHYRSYGTFANAFILSKCDA